MILTEEQAWTQILERYQKPLFTQAFKFTRDEGDAEDMVGQVFLKAYENRMHIDPEKLHGWLFTTCTRMGIAYWRRRKLLQQYINRRREYEDVESLSMEDLELKHGVWELVFQLPELFQEVILLRYLVGMDNQEISQYLEIPIKTVRTRIFRALGRLRAMLQRQI